MWFHVGVLLLSPARLEIQRTPDTPLIIARCREYEFEK